MGVDIAPVYKPQHFSVNEEVKDEFLVGTSYGGYIPDRKREIVPILKQVFQRLRAGARSPVQAAFVKRLDDPQA
jgi:hypothetical protein